MTVDKLPGCPASGFVNDIKADLHDVNTAYVALDNHKFGDYSPYLSSIIVNFVIPISIDSFSDVNSAISLLIKSAVNI